MCAFPTCDRRVSYKLMCIHLAMPRTASGGADGEGDGRHAKSISQSGGSVGCVDASSHQRSFRV